MYKKLRPTQSGLSQFTRKLVADIFLLFKQNNGMRYRKLAIYNNSYIQIIFYRFHLPVKVKKGIAEVRPRDQ